MGALSSDVDFRAALRAWEIATTPRRGYGTSELEAELQSQNREKREAAEAEVAGDFARIILIAYRWSRLNPKGADLNAALGRNMHGMLRWLSAAMKLSEEKGMGYQTSEKEIAARSEDTEGRKVIGRVLSESVPPCWSPRWAAERKALRAYSFAEQFEAEMLNVINAQIPIIDADVTAELAKQKKEKRPKNLDRAIVLQVPKLTKRLLSAMRGIEEKQKEIERKGQDEIKQMEALIRLTAEARDSAWGILRKHKIPRPPKAPEVQQREVEDWIESDDDDDDTDAATPSYVGVLKNSNRQNRRPAHGR